MNQQAEATAQPVQEQGLLVLLLLILLADADAALNQAGNPVKALCKSYR